MVSRNQGFVREVEQEGRPGRPKLCYLDSATWSSKLGVICRGLSVPKKVATSDRHSGASKSLCLQVARLVRKTAPL